MRTLRSIVLSAYCFIPIVGVASDINYQLNNKALVAVEESKLPDSVEVSITDRVWAAPGIEQSNNELLPPRQFDLADVKAAEHFQNEHPTIRGGRAFCHHDPCEGPQWIDEVAWPRTRELYGLGQPYYGGDTRTEYTFGLITLQR